MKLSDYVAKFLRDQGIKHVFAISGGASLHLIHSVADTPGIDFICPQHEQAGAMAADAYARVTNNLGAAISTSGPGATNMITGICCAFYDSVPVLYITGQVSTFRFKGGTGIRQMGFQETDIVEMCAPVTKYAVQVTDPCRIRYELEKACHLARTGRPGPVLIDIPDNLQRATIDPDELQPFVADIKPCSEKISERQLEKIFELVASAERPVLVLGWGIRLAGAEKECVEFIDKLGFPVLPTWAVSDLLTHDHPLLVGAFGTHGTRYGNFAIQNSDLVLSIGARLDTKATGGFDTFAREACKIVVDIDQAELNKFKTFGMYVDILVNADARDFLTTANNYLDCKKAPGQNRLAWLSRIAEWKRLYPICKPEYYEQSNLNPYVFVKALSDLAPEDALVIVDTGCTVAWMSQAFEFKSGQRLFHDFNNTAMGYALPASIAASLAHGNCPVLCVSGDGSMLMNIQELATIHKLNLPIKIFLVNNHGHSMIQQTQDQWLGSRYLASSVDGGLASPDFLEIARGFGLQTFDIDTNIGIKDKIDEVLHSPGPAVCQLDISPSHRVMPQVKFGRPIEDSEPLLERDEFVSNMIVAPVVIPAKTKQKILVVGADGQIGNALSAKLQAEHSVTLTTRRRNSVSGQRLLLDLCGLKAHLPQLPQTNTAFICAAQTPATLCRQNPEQTRPINVAATVALAKALANAGNHVIFLSSSQVFDGTVPFRKSSDPLCPTTEYGRQKAEVESQLLSLGEQITIVRLSRVLTDHTPLLLEWMHALRHGKIIRPFSDAVLAPLSLSFVTDVLARLADIETSGIIQISGPEDITYESLARYLATRLQADQGLIHPQAVAESGRDLDPPPRHTTLDTSQLQKVLGMQPEDVWAVVDSVLTNKLALYHSLAK